MIQVPSLFEIGWSGRSSRSTAVHLVNVRLKCKVVGRTEGDGARPLYVEFTEAMAHIFVNIGAGRDPQR